MSTYYYACRNPFELRVETNPPELAERGLAPYVIRVDVVDQDGETTYAGRLSFKDKDDAMAFARCFSDEMTEVVQVSASRHGPTAKQCHAYYPLDRTIISEYGEISTLRKVLGRVRAAQAQAQAQAQDEDDGESGDD